MVQHSLSFRIPSCTFQRQTPKMGEQKVKITWIPHQESFSFPIPKLSRNCSSGQLRVFFSLLLWLEPKQEYFQLITGIKLASHLTANLPGCGLDQHSFTISNTLQVYLAGAFWDGNSCRLMGLALPGLPESRSPSREGGGVTRCQPKQQGVLLVPQNKNMKTQELVKNKALTFS